MFCHGYGNLRSTLEHEVITKKNTAGPLSTVFLYLHAIPGPVFVAMQRLQFNRGAGHDWAHRLSTRATPRRPEMQFVQMYPNAR